VRSFVDLGPGQHGRMTTRWSRHGRNMYGLLAKSTIATDACGCGASTGCRPKYIILSDGKRVPRVWSRLEFVCICVCVHVLPLVAVCFAATEPLGDSDGCGRPVCRGRRIGPPSPPLRGGGGGGWSPPTPTRPAPPRPAGPSALLPAVRAVRLVKPEIQRRALSPFLAMPLAPWCSCGAWSGLSGVPFVDRPCLSFFRLALSTAGAAESHCLRASVAAPCCFPVCRCVVEIFAELCRCGRFGVLRCRLRRAARGDSSCIDFVLHLDLPGHPRRFVARRPGKEKCVIVRVFPASN